MNRLVLLALLAAGCSSGVNRPTVPEFEPYTPKPATEALEVGDKFPPLQAGGWVNGPPPAPDAPGVKLLFVDLWSEWCPYCRQSAPALVRLHKKYADRGVAFVSASNLIQGGVEQFVSQFKIPWPSGYLMSADLLPALGASSGMNMEGYALAPVVYLVGPDGKIRWSDKQSRYRHLKNANVAVWEQELDAAIEAELGGKP